jgi:hypothetical protein
MAKNARAAAVDKYSPEKVLPQFSEVLLSVDIGHGQPLCDNLPLDRGVT